MEETGNVPPALKTKPELHNDLVWVDRAFRIIDRARVTGMGPSRLSLKYIKDYLEMYPINDKYEKDRFIRLVLAMDDEYMTWAIEKTKT